MVAVKEESNDELADTSDDDDDLLNEGLNLEAAKKSRRNQEARRAEKFSFINKAMENSARKQEQDIRIERLKEEDVIDEDEQAAKAKSRTQGNPLKRTRQILRDCNDDNYIDADHDADNEDCEEQLSEKHQQLYSAMKTGAPSWGGTRNTLTWVPSHGRDCALDAASSEQTTVSSRMQAAVNDLEKRLELGEMSDFGKHIRSAIEHNVLVPFLRECKLARLSRTLEKPLPETLVEWLFVNSWASSKDLFAPNELSAAAFACLSDYWTHLHPTKRHRGSDGPHRRPIHSFSVQLSDMTATLQNEFGLVTGPLTEHIAIVLDLSEETEGTKDKGRCQVTTFATERFRRWLILWNILIQQGAFDQEDSADVPQLLIDCAISIFRVLLDPSVQPGQK